MAKLVMGVLGGFSGKVGTVVGSIWKGIATIRAYVANVTNPNTPAQLEQRSKFKLIIEFLRPLTAFLRVGYKSLATQKTAFNAAAKYNLANALTGTYPDFTINYPEVKVSRGNLPGPSGYTATSTVPTEINFAWTDNSWEQGSAAEDKAMLVVYDPARGMSVNITGGGQRDAGSQVITLPEAFSGDLVQCYLAFGDPTGAVCSDSQFVGAVTVL